MTAHPIGNDIQAQGGVEKKAVFVGLADFTGIAQTGCLNPDHDFPLGFITNRNPGSLSSKILISQRKKLSLRPTLLERRPVIRGTLSVKVDGTGGAVVMPCKVRPPKACET
jgi:hypothetical protein